MTILNRVAVSVPATTANLGPGFDCLGLALDIYNTVAVEINDSFSISITGQGAESLPRGDDNRVYQSILALYQRAARPVPELRIRCRNDIPLARGLGSSAAATMSGLLAANILCGKVLSQRELLSLGASLEGHPDNMAPALLGGCQAVVWDGREVISAQVPWPPGLKAALFIPDFEMPTEKARAILPAEVTRADAVFNIARVALLVTALAQGQLQYLRIATQDRLHQPQRRALFPAMNDIFEAALDAGAVGVFLSGSGPTILALAQDNDVAIAEAMASAAKEAGVQGQIRIAQPSMVGAHVVTAEESLWP